jgi:hypothetical protein
MHNIKEKVNNFAKGEISVFQRDRDSGESSLVFHKDNLITYGAADIMAKLLSGDSRYAISHMYFKFKNGTPTNDSISRSSNAAQFLAMDGTNDEDWLRIPIITNGAISKSPHDSVDFSGNKVTFVATTAAAPTVGSEIIGEAGEPFSDSTPSGSSKIFSIALVAAPEKQNKAHDVVFARTHISSITAIANSYIDVFWSVTFL